METTTLRRRKEMLKELHNVKENDNLETKCVSDVECFLKLVAPHAAPIECDICFDL